jgi:hypothetical protein
VPGLVGDLGKAAELSPLGHMPRRIFPLVVGLALGGVGLGAGPALGEGFLDLYGGVANTESVRVMAGHRRCTSVFLFGSSCSPETKATRDADFDISPEYGIRGGYWFAGFPYVGLAGDLSTFRAEADNVKFHLIPFSLLFMARVPLWRTDEIPGGQLQPYLGLGPTLFYQKATVDYRPEVGQRVKLNSVEVGFDARLGLAWQFHKQVGLFAEYRFTYLPVSADDDDDDFGGARTERVDGRLKTHHLLLGVSIRF